MLNLLEDLYKLDIKIDKNYSRKLSLEENISYMVVGVAGSGKTKLIKNHLSGLKKGSYLYINCSDFRLDIDGLNTLLSQFCLKNHIDTLVLDNYKSTINIPNVPVLILSSELNLGYDFLKTLRLYPLSYEEFLAYEGKYDVSALNQYLNLGGFYEFYQKTSDERIYGIQNLLKTSLDEIPLNILLQSSKMLAQKISPFAIYERLKNHIKISKDKLYSSYANLLERNYIHELPKLNHPKATKKLYICDITLKNALSNIKNFSRIFENLIYLELLKSNHDSFYDEGVDFYIPSKNMVVLASPFADERAIFKKLESMESFIFMHGVKTINIVSVNNEITINHPFAKVEILPFDRWALSL
ncbi:MAG: ATP-binding protein [Sulfurimonas sp.]|jgi:predicted AAA+ superfamily ATPase|nr:ATP-binding protein [Sulfurimonadaceae bacterium]